MDQVKLIVIVKCKSLKELSQSASVFHVNCSELFFSPVAANRKTFTVV